MTDKPFLFSVARQAFRELEFDSGGFRMLFENDFPFRPPYSFFSAAYRKIGAVRAATCIDQAALMFPFEKPHESKQKRNIFMDSLEESHDIFQLGNEISRDETIWSKLEEYVRMNRLVWTDESCEFGNNSVGA